MTVCLDTNVLIQARASRHPYGVLLDALVFGSINWAVSNRVLTEYQEIIVIKAGPHAWATLAHLIDLIDISGNLISVSPHFQFLVIEGDADDNAFTDCAIAAHAEFVITEDQHFAPRPNAGYKPQPIIPYEFVRRYTGVCL